MNPLCLGSSLRTISVLGLHLLIHFCRGQSRLIGSSQPIVANVGDDVILPCHLDPAVDAAAKMLEWTRPDLSPRFVFVWFAGQDYESIKNLLYKGRTSLFTDELKRGNISLKLSNVKPADEGRYRCYIPDRNEESLIQLVVAAVSSPGITLAGLDESSSAVVLQCESKGWYPEPEVTWLDGEGHVLSAGPTETVRGPDDLYTVSSRVTVDKRHGNRFTCRVQQNIINQTRETHLHVSDDFYTVQSSSSATTVGLAVGLTLCIVLIILLVLVLWRKEKNKSQSIRQKSNRKQQDKTDAENRTEDENDRLQSGSRQAAAARSSSSVWPFVAKPRFHQVKEEAQRLKNELRTTEQEMDGNLKDTNNQLQEEKQKRGKTEEELKTLKNQLDELNRDLTRTKHQLQEETKKRETAEEEVTRLNNQLRENKESADRKWTETNEQLTMKTKEFDKLQDEIQRRKETEEQLNNKTKEVQTLSTERIRFEDKVKKLEKDMETKLTELSEEKKQHEASVKKFEEKLETTKQKVLSP